MTRLWAGVLFTMTAMSSGMGMAHSGEAGNPGTPFCDQVGDPGTQCCRHRYDGDPSPGCYQHSTMESPLVASPLAAPTCSR